MRDEDVGRFGIEEGRYAIHGLGEELGLGAQGGRRRGAVTGRDTGRFFPGDAVGAGNAGAVDRGPVLEELGLPASPRPGLSPGAPGPFRGGARGPVRRGHVTGAGDGRPWGGRARGAEKCAGIEIGKGPEEDLLAMPFHPYGRDRLFGASADMEARPGEEPRPEGKPRGRVVVARYDDDDGAVGKGGGPRKEVVKQGYRLGRRYGPVVDVSGEEEDVDPAG